MQSVAPIVSTLFLICLAAPIGIYPIRKYIQIQEAKHELKHGSAGFIRSFGGWIIIAIWVAVVWFIATILGDWWAPMTKPATIAQADLRCTSCAGQCRFDPNSGDLTCESCGNAHEIYVDPNIDPAAEQHYHPDLPHTEQPVFSQDLPFECETCGGEVVFFGHSIAETCPYCAGALVQQAQGQSYDTLGMIPFCVGDDLAQAATQTWIAKRWAAPSDLGDVVAKGRVAGIYVPFWTFDSHEAVDYTHR